MLEENNLVNESTSRRNFLKLTGAVLFGGGAAYLLKGDKEPNFPVIKDGFIEMPVIGNRQYDIQLLYMPELPKRGFQIKNLGERPVDFWMWLNNQPNYHNLERLMESIINPKMKDSEKAMTVFNLFKEGMQHQHLVLYGPAEVGEVDCPIRSFLVYGYGMCSDTRNRAAIMLGQIGIPSKPILLYDHTINELFIDGRWQCFDFNQRVLIEDLGRILGYDEIVDSLSNQDDKMYNKKAPFAFITPPLMRNLFLNPNGQPFQQVDKHPIYFNREMARIAKPNLVEGVEFVRVKRIFDHKGQLSLLPGQTFVLPEIPGGDFWGSSISAENPVNRGYLPPYANGHFNIRFSLEDAEKFRRLGCKDVFVSEDRESFGIRMSAPYLFLDTRITTDSSQLVEVWFNKERETFFELSNYPDSWRKIGEVKAGLSLSLKEKGLLNGKPVDGINYPAYNFWLGFDCCKDNPSFRIDATYQTAYPSIPKLEIGKNILHAYTSEENPELRIVNKSPLEINVGSVRVSFFSN